MGVEFRLAEPVQEILFEGRRAKGVRTQAGAHHFDALVINADFAQAMTTLVPDRLRRRWTDRKLARKKFSCSTFMLYLGLKGELPELEHHTILLAKDYRRNVREIEAGLAPPADPSLYVQNACVTDAGTGATRPLHPLCPGPRRQPRPRRHRLAGGQQAGYRALALQRLEQLGVRDIESRIRVRKAAHPGGLGTRPQHPPRRNLQPRAFVATDAAFPPAQPVRGSGRRLLWSAAARTPAAACR